MLATRVYKQPRNRKVIAIWQHHAKKNKKGGKGIFLALSEANEKIKRRILMSKPFPGTEMWLFSIINTKREHGPERNVWPSEVTGMKAKVPAYWKYNGSKTREEIVEKFSTLTNLKQ